MELFFVLLIPLILAAVAVTGTVKGVDVYEGLSTGALDGLRILVRILPPLVGLMTAVYMLRASGLLDLAARGLARCFTSWGFRRRPSACFLSAPSAAAAPWEWGPSSFRATVPIL